MTNIYFHEYTFTPMRRENKLPEIKAITIEVVTDSANRDTIEAERLARILFDTDCNVTHKILITGYRND